jgi:hypothetical protein
MENSDSDSALLKLSKADNILVLRRSISAGEILKIGDAEFPAPADLGLGHKIAAFPIEEGEKIIKYGAPIGSATRAIQAGEHVHLHNIKSDYLPTYTHDNAFTYHDS